MIHFSNRTSGFSTLMALGTIGILLIIVVGLANLYINEMRLSRISYDEVVAAAGAEGAFEYGMLKARNHREGFEDSLSTTEPDGLMLELSSERSKNMKSSYTIESSSIDKIFTVGQNEHLIIPLFASSESLISPGSTSKNPQKNSGENKVANLHVSGLAGLSWTIVAMSGSESSGLSGNDDITTMTIGSVRERSADCYDIDGNKLSNCQGAYAESLDYFYDREVAIGSFLSDVGISDPYLMIYNPTGSKYIHITSDPGTPFSLPEMTIEASAKKNQSLQVFRFTEDRSKYYEALKYGIYNKD